MVLGRTGWRNRSTIFNRVLLFHFFPSRSIVFVSCPSYAFVRIKEEVLCLSLFLSLSIEHANTFRRRLFSWHSEQIKWLRDTQGSHEERTLLTCTILWWKIDADCIIIILSSLSIVVTHRVSEMPFPNVSARDDRHSGTFADTRQCSAMQLHRPDPSVLRTPSTCGVVSFPATLRCFPTRLEKNSIVDISRISISIATYATCSERQRNDRQCVLLVQWREPSRARTSERETKPRRERARRRESEQDSQSGWSAARDRSRSVARQGVFSSRSRTSQSLLCQRSRVSIDRCDSNAVLTKLRNNARNDATADTWHHPDHAQPGKWRHETRAGHYRLAPACIILTVWNFRARTRTRETVGYVHSGSIFTTILWLDAPCRRSVAARYRRILAFRKHCESQTRGLCRDGDHFSLANSIDPLYGYVIFNGKINVFF